MSISAWASVCIYRFTVAGEVWTRQDFTVIEATLVNYICWVDGWGLGVEVVVNSVSDLVVVVCRGIIAVSVIQPASKGFHP